MLFSSNTMLTMTNGQNICEYLQINGSHYLHFNYFF